MSISDKMLMEYTIQGFPDWKVEVRKAFPEEVAIEVRSEGGLRCEGVETGVAYIKATGERV